MDRAVWRGPAEVLLAAHLGTATLARGQNGYSWRAVAVAR